MTARTHDAFAFASFVTAAVLFPPQKITLLTLGVSIIANNIGGLFPDLDQASNRLWDLLPGDHAMGNALRKLFLAHRTITHSALGLGIVWFVGTQWLSKMFNPAYIDGTVVFWSFFVGILSHMIADSLTKEGLPLLFPIPWKFGIPPIKALRVTTGSWVENFVVLPGVGIYLLWFIWIHQVEILFLFRTIRL